MGACEKPVRRGGGWRCEGEGCVEEGCGGVGCGMGDGALGGRSRTDAVWTDGRSGVSGELVPVLQQGANWQTRTRNNAIMWRIVLEFEIRTGQMQRAKSLLHRAVEESPLSKGT
jgi:hypothetical protein